MWKQWKQAVQETWISTAGQLCQLRGQVPSILPGKWHHRNYHKDPLDLITVTGRSEVEGGPRTLSLIEAFGVFKNEKKMPSYFFGFRNCIKQIIPFIRWKIPCNLWPITIYSLYTRNRFLKTHKLKFYNVNSQSCQFVARNLLILR